MARSIESLKTAALKIRDERSKGANTAERIGSFLLDLLEYCIPIVQDFSTAAGSEKKVISQKAISQKISEIEAKSGGDGKRLLLDINPPVIYSDRPTLITATATLKNAVSSINIQFENLNQVWISPNPVSSFSQTTEVSGQETVRAYTDIDGKRLEAIVGLEEVSPIFFGPAYYPDELHNDQAATPRRNPRGEYRATIQKGYSMCFLIPEEMGHLNLDKITWNGFLFPLSEKGIYDMVLKDGQHHNYYQYDSGSFEESTDVLIKIE